MRPLPFLAADTPAARDPRRPAIIVPVQVGPGGGTEAVAVELAQRCREAATTGRVDVIEWRIDPLLPDLDPSVRASASSGALTRVDAAAEVVLGCVGAVRSAGLPVLITLRSAFEGGRAEVTEEEYAVVLTRIIEGADAAGSGADGARLALDIEISREQAGSLIDAAHAASWSVVASHHNFMATDADLAATFSAMEAAGADVAKIAMMPTSGADVARMLAATAQASGSLGVPVLGISMGEAGRTTRIMGADFGSCATFAQLGRASAPGQIDATTLAEILDRVLTGDSPA